MEDEKKKKNGQRKFSSYAANQSTFYFIAGGEFLKILIFVREKNV